MFNRTVLLSLLLLPIIAVAAHAADFDPKAATDAYLATIIAKQAKSDAYFEGGYWLILYDALYAIGVSLLLLFTRVASGLRSLMERMLPWRWLQTFGFVVCSRR
jgi:STE24 endopeptidase